MAAHIVIRVSSTGSERQLVELEVPASETVAQLKERIHASNRKLHPLRVALRTGPKSKNLGDDMQIKDIDWVDRAAKIKQIYFKDLGPQVSWTTVFLTEYAGPLFLYLLFYIRPGVLYGSAASGQEIHYNVKIAMMCHTFHYLKRLLETVFVHRFSKATMPIMNIVKNSTYYWGFAAWMAYFINHPLYTPVSDKVFYPALGGFIFSELGNFFIHVALRDLRPPGTKVRAIPKPTLNPFTWLFSLVSCPNYTYEIMAWISFSIMTGTLTSYFFTLAGGYQMIIWALGKHRNYRKEFSHYPKERKAIIPFLL